MKGRVPCNGRFDPPKVTISAPGVLLDSLIRGSQIAGASQALSTGDFVNAYNSAGNLRLRLAEPSDETKFANGFVRSAVSNRASGSAYFGGFDSLATVVTPAAGVWLNDVTPGGFMTPPPKAPGSIIQPLGLAIVGVGILFSLQHRKAL